jgi:hypothetical protein
MADKRIVLIANKNWETAPLMNVLLEPRACPPAFPWPSTQWPLEAWQAGATKKTAPDVSSPHPRAIFPFTGKTAAGAAVTVEVEVWCLQDWMSPDKSSSSTEEKVRVLPSLLGWSKDGKKPAPADLVIAFGTAGFPAATSYNGTVVVGAQAFIHNAYPKGSNSSSQWDDSSIKRPIEATLSPKFFEPRSGVITDSLRAEIETRCVVPPIAPGEERILIAAHNYTAVGVVNVTNYDDYAWADHGAVEAFHGSGQKTALGSIETTHAVIRVQSEAPFLFISAITDRLGAFNMEVTPRPYSQNYAAAHNAGVVTAWLLPKIASFLGS